ncbi:MAG: replicative DNA helicase [Proteobacteria bacterium]|nr:replicative DNA helicase [Pseudomonadota bacterium]MBI3497830.1 replicative DNA helicase [Pseudomonadota bacterium]
MEPNRSPTNVTALPERDSTPYRTPPHNYEAEQGLLGALLVNNNAFEKVGDFLRPEHFTDPVHGRIFEAIGKLIDRGHIANPVTLKAYFDQDNALAEVGGAQYLVRLAASVVSIINAEDYGRTIHDLYLRRQLIGVGEDMVNEAFKHELDISAADQIEQAEEKLFNLAEADRTESGFRGFNTILKNAVEMAEAAHKRDGQLSGVPTGLVDLDKLLGGLHPSDLLICAGRPSMGKSALAANIAFNAASMCVDDPEAERHVIGFFELEMSAEQLATRVLAEQIEMPGEKIRRGELGVEDFRKLVRASQRLERTPIFIDDTPAITVSALRTRARRLKRQHGLSLIVVDYLQLMRPTVGHRQENRVQEVSDISRGLKAIAMELNVPVLACAQLSRAVEQREDKRPQLSDLRESGSIEQDADVVMFIYREQYYLERSEPTRRADETDDKFHDRTEKWKERCEQVYGLAEVIVAKQRHGPTGKVTLQFAGATTKFSNAALPGHLPDATI